MKRANRIASLSTLALNMRLIRAVAVSVFASAVLAACGGGAATTENPLTQAAPPGNAPYTGPVARDADVLKFQQEFWSNAKTSDRCGSCHNEVVGQTPMFVRNDDVNLAYDEALTVVNTTQPALSRLVEKVGGGHNCWNADPSSCAAIMTTWIARAPASIFRRTRPHSRPRFTPCWSQIAPGVTARNLRRRSNHILPSRTWLPPMTRPNRR
jgi:hypothetical protein